MSITVSTVLFALIQLQFSHICRRCDDRVHSEISCCFSATVVSLGLSLKDSPSTLRWHRPLKQTSSSARRAAKRPSEENPYVILDIPFDASSADVKAAFRGLAKILHPDVPRTGNAEAFQIISWAAKELSTTQGRRRWALADLMVLTEFDLKSDETEESEDEEDVDVDDFELDIAGWPFGETGGAFIEREDDAVYPSTRYDDGFLPKSEIPVVIPFDDERYAHLWRDKQT